MTKRLAPFWKRPVVYVQGALLMTAVAYVALRSAAAISIYVILAPIGIALAWAALSLFRAPKTPKLIALGVLLTVGFVTELIARLDPTPACLVAGLIAIGANWRAEAVGKERTNA